MEGSSDSRRMERAYHLAGSAWRDKLRRDRPDDHQRLDAIRPAEVVVVHGNYDRLHLVLEATGIAHLHIAPQQLAAADWERMQVLMINCPGNLPQEALDKIAPWVRGGGYLVTTDWALRHVVEPLFPGTVRHNRQQTSDCVVRVQIATGETDPLLSGFLENGRDPLWWLEGSSYPIEVIDPARVRVLVESAEVGERWGAKPVVVTFEEGEGTVLHLLSHLYLQRTDVRDASDRQPGATVFAGAAEYAGIDVQHYAAAAGDLLASEVRSAVSSSELLHEAILGARKKAERRGGAR